MRAPRPPTAPAQSARSCSRDHARLPHASSAAADSAGAERALLLARPRAAASRMRAHPRGSHRAEAVGKSVDGSGALVCAFMLARRWLAMRGRAARWREHAPATSARSIRASSPRVVDRASSTARRRPRVVGDHASSPAVAARSRSVELRDSLSAQLDEAVAVGVDRAEDRERLVRAAEVEEGACLARGPPMRITPSRSNWTSGRASHAGSATRCAMCS